MNARIKRLIEDGRVAGDGSYFDDLANAVEEAEEVMMEIRETRMHDVRSIEVEQFEISEDGRTVYAHADGVTLLRAGHVGEVVITDHREAPTCEHGEEGPHNYAGPGDEGAPLHRCRGPRKH